MRIREATLHDIPATFAVRLAVTENAIDRERLLYLGITPESVAQLLRTSSKAWVAEADGTVVGFSIANAETKSIWALFVLPGYEGRGYGRDLLAAAVDWLWRQGVDEIWLNTGRDPSTRANGFYRHLGWQPAGDQPGDEVRYVLRRPPVAEAPR